MATLRTKLILSSATASSDSLSLTATDTLVIKSPSVGLSRLIIDTTGANNIIVPANADTRIYGGLLTISVE